MTDPSRVLYIIRQTRWPAWLVSRRSLRKALFPGIHAPKISPRFALMRRIPTVIRLVLATLLSCIVGGVALGASPDTSLPAPRFLTSDQILASALRQSIGAPTRVPIDDQAVERLSDDLIIVPREPGSQLLAISGKLFPPDLEFLLLGSEGLEAPGIVRFVPAGFIDSDVALRWTSDDMLSSLDSTVMRGNADRLKKKKQELEARRWVLPPHYDPETHQISWAALVIPKSAPRDSDGETTYHAVAFGRDGYVELSIVSSMQKADVISHMMDNFLTGLTFVPGKAYGDVVSGDRRASDGLAGAMGIDSLHKAPSVGGLWGTDTMIPAAGGVVATIGALGLLIYIRRHMRHEARRG
jgi:uncharacterized membrane-anchored protein